MRLWNSTIVNELPEAEPVAVATDEFHLGALRDARIRVLSGIPVKVTKVDGSFRAEAPTLNEFGFGTDSYEAVADLQETIAELFFTLEEKQDDLGPGLSEVWLKLQQYATRRK